MKESNIGIMHGGFKDDTVRDRHVLKGVFSSSSYHSECLLHCAVIERDANILPAYISTASNISSSVHKRINFTKVGLIAG